MRYIALGFSIIVATAVVVFIGVVFVAFPLYLLGSGLVAMFG
jgi:hypothetical protein